jgi:signal transduction histidine kinase
MPGKTATILIVEDDYIVARTLQKTLLELGYPVAGMTSTGQEAIELAGKYRPALILLDIHLKSSMDGIETARKIHELYRIPVVYVTAYSDDRTFSRAIGTALYGYLIKPVTANALRNTIEIALEKHRIEKSLRQANKKLALLSSITRHDILNTLTALVSVNDLARLKAEDSSISEYLDRQARLLSLVQKQVGFARDYECLGMGQPVWHDLKKLISATAAQALPDTIRIEVTMQDLQIFADPLFERVIYNLLDNAVRHGATVTRVRFLAREENEGLAITCEDNGIGIAEEEKERIFERGFGKNTGLGLFLVREILDTMESSIRETGTPGSGAVFEIQIPRGSYRFQ